MPNSSDLSHSLFAEMHLDGASFRVDTVEYGLNRNADARGFPTDAPKRTMINMKISPLQDSEVRLIYDWALHSDLKKDGFLVFTRADDTTLEVRRMDFLEATCVGFRESFFNEELNAVHERRLGYTPNSREYLPEHRGRSYFADDAGTRSYQLVISATSLLIEHTEIPS